MIKASDFSLKCGLFKDLTSKFQVPTQHDKSPLYFLSGDPTFYGHKQLKMSEEGYEIIRRSIKQEGSAGLPDQSEGLLSARASVAKHFGSEESKLTSSDVILTHGANMGLFNLLLSILNPGDNILVPEPGYPFFHLTASAMNVQVRPYQLQAEKGFEINLTELAKLVDKNTRFLWVVNPSNPCGSVFEKTHMEKIVDFCREHNLFLVSDEVYWNESFSTSVFTSFGHLARNEVPVIVAGGLEKTFLVPGWSVSWLLFFDKQDRLSQIKRACRITADIFEGPASFMQYSLPELLDTLTPNYTKNFMGLFESNYHYLYKSFSSIEGLKPVQAQGTFYIAVTINLDKFQGFSSDQEFLQALLTEENVWILNLSAFNGQEQGFRMMTCATTEIYQQLIPRIEHFCSSHLKIKDSC